MRCASSRPSAERCKTPLWTMPWAFSTRSRSAPAWKSLVPESSCLELLSSKSSTKRTCPTPETMSRSPSSNASAALQPLKACELFSTSASSSRSTRSSTSCNSRVSQLWILDASIGISFVWKFLAHQSAASALRKPWKSAKALAGVSTKLRGNLRATRAIFGSPFSSTVRSSFAPFRTTLAPAARAVTANSQPLCGASTSWNCFVFLSFIMY
mmetsp:Transcript_29685/g.75571  ORF Transcript_29685/g.75571 Transcript_29685/m.75571 type:complete len:212 (-) Transcript_29685:540-1175(-)